MRSLASLKCCTGLAAGLWLASADAQPTYTPVTLDNPTPEAEAWFGRAVAGAGDVNGDGIPDVLVGAHGQGEGRDVFQGRAFVFSGADGSRLLTLDDPTPQVFAEFGRAVVGAGDVNGDGTPDLLVGAPGQEVGGNPRQGQAYVFSGADGSLVLTLNDPTPQRSSAFFGFAVAGAGDVNRDGRPDLLVGAFGQAVGAVARQGQAFVFSGADGSLLLTLDDPAPQVFSDFGFALAGVGDLTGDGIPDFLVGADGHEVDGNRFQGQAFVFSGADGSLLLTLDDPAPQAFATFGLAVAGLGDVNSDGTPDLLVGAPWQEPGGDVRQGQAFVFSGIDGSLLLTLDHPTPQAFAFFGRAVAEAGDANSDGVPDLLVGAPGQDVDGNVNRGQAFVFSGADGSLLRTLDNAAPPTSAEFGFGYSVAGVGDVNVDGAPDLLVGAPEQDVGGNVHQGQAVLFISATTEIEVAMDIVPKALNLKSKGVIPVAILTTSTFDATGVDPSSVRFGPADATEAHDRGHLEDVNGDGETDIVLHFRTEATGLKCGDTEASLTGQTFAGDPIRGSDSFVTVGCR